MFRTRTLAALAVLGLFALPALAEDGESTRVTKEVDLRRYQVPAAAPGSRLPVPSDIVAAQGDPGDGSLWSLDRAEDSRTWLPFEEPALEAHAVSTDTVIEVLRSTLAHRSDLVDALSIDALEDGLLLAGNPEAVAAGSSRMDWILRGLAPSLRVDAVLTGSSAGGEPRLRAMGGLTLWPGRWTRVYLQENGLPCTPDWDIEVAQESTTMDPIPINVVEGRELYLRYHPGETVSVVEVWSGDVEHLELLRDDLSGIRNVPEGNGLGVVSYPRSAVQRVFTQLLIPTGTASQREIRWTNEGRSLRLLLRIGAAAATSTDLKRGERNGLALLRAGATAAGLGFGARSRGTDTWTERLSADLYAAAEAYEKRGRAFEFSVSPVDGGSIFLLAAPEAELGKARATIRAAEKRLASREVQVEVWTVPESAWRGYVLDGRGRVGQPVTAGVLQALREAGAATGESFTAPALVGIPLGFRVGHSRPGIIDYEPELAQQSAGLQPVTSARFHGLYGEVRVRTMNGGHAVRVRGAYCTAASNARGVEIQMRAPVSMKGDSAVPQRGVRSELVPLPILTGTHAAIDREVDVPTGVVGPVLVHAHVQGEEVILVLVTLGN